MAKRVEVIPNIIELAAWPPADRLRRDGKWKVLTAHIGLNPIENPIIDAVEGLRWIWGGVGAALGLALGVLGTLLLRRRKA